ncbi:hypothetical protein A3D71_03690 [Candidatus Kaiserbacteria bacterium RIFCSPHIGHO2_02_FULL_55_20]|uniref:PNPLA domain-containing protein n=1 Tax=Candidatus Kaiserbacteria bacterium RIFCSPHIGHO2_02_FULL_55_20 TaxID=1798497 RepID=A0A1F6DY35_9BACT|nr:MAG: hypothetical protein A2680_03885 [Candidatus Kaiserbacteria bacterium RIFCSPHIGHO2_01_FULL_55_37]OGG66318.1 MAG: hypothetical protein A3D71_03690 [Candidatus Kaiserbacteria bacterium RIFCSPHIGHO2_02_FULL_55_20]
MNISIVAEGGGIRGAYVFGVAEALWSHYGLHRVDVVVGTSASAGTVAYYASGQHRLGRPVWLNEISSPRFINARNILRNRTVVDIDYMIDTVFKRRFPLDPIALKSSPVRCIIPVESYRTGKIEYIDATESPFDIFEVLRASSAVPIVYHKLVTLGNEKYFDPYFTEPLSLENSYVCGSRKIIILSKPRTRVSLRSARIAELWRPALPRRIYRTLHESDARRNAMMDTCDSLEKDGDVIIAPAALYGKNLDNRPAVIADLFHRGYEDALANEPLKKLIAELKARPRSDFYFPAYL